MQKSIILELVNNGTDFKDRQELFENKEYWQSNTDFNIIIDELCEDLSDDEREKTLEKIFNVLGALEGVVADEYFKKGFKLGLMLAAQNFLD